MYYVYILECADGTFYTGITNDIKHRMAMHGEGKGSKYVRSRLPFKLKYQEEFQTRSEALKREIQIKNLTRVQKQQLI